MTKLAALILTNKDGEVVYSFTKPFDVDHYKFVLEDDGKTYVAVQELKHFGERIATIYQEETNDSL